MGKSITAIVAAMALAAIVALGGCASGAPSSSSAVSSSLASTSASASISSASSASAGVNVSDSSASASSAASGPVASAQKLAYGEYSATFATDSSMFHANEASDGKGDLTVSDGGMTIHVSLASKKIVNLYVGKAADAEADTANWIQPTVDSVTNGDGVTEEVYGFDIPVPAIDEEFDVAILGEKGTWYDHVVSVSDPIAR